MAVVNARFAPPKAVLDVDGIVGNERRLHRLTSISLALFFSNFAAAFLVWQNARWLGRRRDAWIGVILYGLLFAGSAALFTVWQPSVPLMICATLGLRMAGGSLIAIALQRRFLRAHKLAGGAFRSRWIGAAAGVGFALTLAVLSFIALAIVAMLQR